MKKLLSLFLVLMIILAMVAGCGNDTPPPPPPPPPTASPTAPASPPPSQGTTPGTPDPDPGAEPDPVPAEPAGPIMISAEELLTMFGDENLILIGMINPTAALVPFSNAANPLRGSYLIWTDDIYGTCPEAISPDLAFGRAPLHEMEDLLSRAGITADSVIVVYASDFPSVGARAAWHLSMLGLNVRFLDGGVAAWRAANGRTGSSNRLNNQRPQNDFRAPNYDPSFNNATIDMVIEALQNPNEWVVIDTRAENEFNGDRSASGAFGTGRLKDAVHVDWVRNHDSNEIMLPEAELRALYNFVGDRKVIVYCQGGVRSAYSWIVMRDLGFDVWNYDGSWIEWSYAASSASNYARKAEVLSLTESWTDNGRAF